MLAKKSTPRDRRQGHRQIGMMVKIIDPLDRGAQLQ